MIGYIKFWIAKELVSASLIVLLMATGAVIVAWIAYKTDYTGGEQ
jgi:hypothetical protein